MIIVENTGDAQHISFSKFYSKEFALVVFGEVAGLPLPDGFLLTGGTGVVNVETVVSLDFKIDFVSFHNNFVWVNSITDSSEFSELASASVSRKILRLYRMANGY